MTDTTDNKPSALETMHDEANGDPASRERRNATPPSPPVEGGTEAAAPVAPADDPRIPRTPDGKLDWTDRRPLDEIKFAKGDGEITDQIRTIFKDAGVEVAQDIANLGCTGLYGAQLRWHAQSDAPEQFALQDAQFVRKNMDGAGIGLTCFVGMDRYCLVHDTIGGLQRGQKQRHEEHVEAVSRELTNKERGHIKYVESAMRTRGKTLDERMIKVGDQLSGYEMPEGVDPNEDPRDNIAEMPSDRQRHDDSSPVQTFESLVGIDNDGSVVVSVDNVATVLGALRALVAAGAGSDAVTDTMELLPETLRDALAPILMMAMANEAAPPWTCTEHGETAWHCRHCIASLVAGGALQPPLLMATGAEPGHVDLNTITDLRDAGKTVEDAIDAYEKGGVAETIAAFAKVATWRRKLARD